ncbi:hypothetical protein BH09PAT2_BH09PAT2_00100 [soil metagenome]
METVISFFKRFFSDLYHAVLFWAQGYDLQLRGTKTPTQRILIWSGIIILALIGFSIFVFLVWKLLDSFEVPTI